jgi:hypothetical protein
MGELHEIWHIKPIVLYGEAFIKIIDSTLEEFRKFYTHQITTRFSSEVFPHNTVLQTSNGKLKLSGRYQINRSVNGKKGSLYLCVQSGNKYGFEQNFSDFLAESSRYCEDSVFFVIYTDSIRKYEIKNGTLHVRYITTYREWDYDFIRFMESEYKHDTTLLKDLYVEKVTYLRLLYDDSITGNDDPGIYLDRGDYSEHLSLIEKAEAIGPDDETESLKAWLLERINQEEKG